MTMKSDKAAQELFAETTKDIAKTFQRAFNRGFWTGVVAGLAIIGAMFLIGPWLWAFIDAINESF